jgi:serine/threonine-protein kinase HipA
VKKLKVVYQGWGERWPLGTLLDVGNTIVFEYDAAAIERGLELSPIHHPLPRPGAAPVTYQGERIFSGLPGFVADSLPDGWGMLLMDRALRRAGREPAAVSVLERLAIVGNTAIGALSFEPAQEDSSPKVELQLKDIAKRIAELQQDKAWTEKDAPDGLQQLLRLGGSPQGARPKVLANFNPRTGVVSTGETLTGAATPWLIKFPAEREHKEVCAMEELYARVARQAGHDMPKSRWFDLGAKYSAFGVERFDRALVKDKQGNKSLLRIPVMSLSAMLQADHRLPSLDYETVLLATLRITGSQPELLKAFERCVLNVLLHNRDDHSRNFAFRLDANGYWKLAPVFDLTFSDGPGGEHSTSVLGHGQDITRAHLLALAKRCGVDAGAALAVLERIRKIEPALPKIAKSLPIRAASTKSLLSAVRLQAQQMDVACQ